MNIWNFNIEFLYLKQSVYKNFYRQLNSLLNGKRGKGGVSVYNKHPSPDYLSWIIGKLIFLPYRIEDGDGRGSQYKIYHAPKTLSKLIEDWKRMSRF